MKRSAAIFAMIMPIGLSLAAVAPAQADQSTSSQAKAAQAAAPANFVKLTLPDGSEGRLPTNRVIRIRKTIASESGQGAKTRIDWLDTMLVREPPESVIALLGPVMPSLGKLLMPDNSPIWFNASFAEGPMPLSRDKLQSGVASGMVLGNRLQYLASTPEQVRDELAARGGNALPIPSPLAGAPRSVEPIEVWDSDVKP